jgi:hypothetical protein
MPEKSGCLLCARSWPSGCRTIERPRVEILHVWGAWATDNKTVLESQQTRGRVDSDSLEHLLSKCFYLIKYENCTVTCRCPTASSSPRILFHSYLFLCYAMRKSYGFPVHPGTVTVATTVLRSFQQQFLLSRCPHKPSQVNIDNTPNDPSSKYSPNVSSKVENISIYLNRLVRADQRMPRSL